MKNRTFAQEARAMEFVIGRLYEEEKYLEERIEENGNDRDRTRLQMVKHFIEMYENY